jgi:glutaconate CoA-transferase subunit B
MFVPSHSKRVFVEGEVDIVGGVGYNPKRWPDGVRQIHVDLRLIVTDLGVLDFGGASHAVRVRSLHPGVTLEKIQESTGFPLERAPGLGTTPGPTREQLEIIRRLDPHNLRATVIKGNPPGVPDSAPPA